MYSNYRTAEQATKFQIGRKKTNPFPIAMYNGGGSGGGGGGGGNGGGSGGGGGNGGNK